MNNVIVNEVTNRNLVLALDYLYRESMKIFETSQLLPAATALIEQLNLEVQPERYGNKRLYQ